MKLNLLPFLTLAAVLAAPAAASPVSAFLAHQANHPEGGVPATVVSPAGTGRALTPEERAALPIGVFDSGVGGLTVLEAILKLDVFNNATGEPGADGVPDFAGERFVYFGDQANMPYGNYPSVDKEPFLRGLVLQDIAFLLSGRGYTHVGAPEATALHQGVKAIVIACNTATAYGLEDIREAVRELGLPVIVVGVVEAGSRGVVPLLRNGEEPDAVAVLATVGTCRSEAYPRTMAAVATAAGLPVPPVVQQGSVGLAGAIEGDPLFLAGQAEQYQGPRVGHPVAPLVPDLAERYNFQNGETVGSPDQPEGWQLATVSAHVRYEVASVVEAHRKSGATAPIGAVMLGCTHFPLVEAEIVGAFADLREWRDADGNTPYANLIRPVVEVIDPATGTARELFVELRRAGLQASQTGTDAPAATFYWSVANPAWPGVVLAPTGGLDSGYKYGREGWPWDREDTIIVPFTRGHLPGSARTLVEGSLPAVAARME